MDIPAFVIRGLSRDIRFLVVGSKLIIIAQLLYHCDLNSNTVIDQLPAPFQALILQELETLASTQSVSVVTRSSAAMTISECYSIGFGGTLDDNKVAYWLHYAASLGSKKAALWYHRVCSALGLTPSTIPTGSDLDQDLEQRLSMMPSELQLTERIRYFNGKVQETARKDPVVCNSASLSSLPMESGTFKLSIFNEADVDDLPPLHLACWLGENDWVRKLIKNADPGAKSTLGLEAVHYACLGGHTSTLRLLLEDYKVHLNKAHYHDVTVLHLAIFFPPKDLASAVSLMLTHGALPEPSTGSIKWEAHDLVLWSTPIIWAIHTRHQALVQLLIPHDPLPKIECLYYAIKGFFWEMIDLFSPLIPKVLDESELSCTEVQEIERPFFHWIAHGNDHVKAIRRSVEVCMRHGWVEKFDDLGFSKLMTVIANAKAVDDLHLIDAIISVSSTAYLKQQLSTEVHPRPALAWAISHSGHNAAWYHTVRLLADMYPIEELEHDYGESNGSFLFQAVTSDSVVGARVLLEKGVNVNQHEQGVLGKTPIQQCVADYGSVEMIELLLEFGARLQDTDSILGENALERMLWGRSQKAIFDLLLKYEHQDLVYINILHSTLAYQSDEFLRGKGFRRDSFENLR